MSLGWMQLLLRTTYRLIISLTCSSSSNRPLPVSGCDPRKTWRVLNTVSGTSLLFHCDKIDNVRQDNMPLPCLSSHLSLLHTFWNWSMVYQTNINLLVHCQLRSSKVGLSAVILIVVLGRFHFNHITDNDELLWLPVPHFWTTVYTNSQAGKLRVVLMKQCMHDSYPGLLTILSKSIAIIDTPV